MGKEIKNKDRDIDVMLAHKYDPMRVGSWKHTFVDPKLDGVRVIIIVMPQKSGVFYYSRNGRQLRMFGHIDKEALKFVARAGEFYDERFLDGGVLDGEMTSESEDFGDISGAIHRIDHTAFDARFFCFHAMPLELFEKGEDDKSQYKRSRMIAKIVRRANMKLIHHHAGEQVFSDEEVQEAYKEQRKEGREGVMVKQMNQPWVAKRSHAWMKVKPVETYEIVVIGVKPGKGKYKGTLGALIYEYEGKECSTSGMSDKERYEWWKLHKKGLLAGRMAEVRSAGVTKHGALRHPRFVRFRDDKAPAATRGTKTGRWTSNGENKANTPKEVRRGKRNRKCEHCGSPDPDNVHTAKCPEAT